MMNSTLIQLTIFQHCGLIDARVSASEKVQPVTPIFDDIISTQKMINL